MLVKLLPPPPKLYFYYFFFLISPPDKFRKISKVTQTLNNSFCARSLEKVSKKHRIEELMGLVNNYFPNVLHMVIVK